MDQDGEAGGAYRMRQRGAHYRGQLPAAHAHAGWMDARSRAEHSADGRMVGETGKGSYLYDNLYLITPS